MKHLMFGACDKNRLSDQMYDVWLMVVYWGYWKRQGVTP